ncbi:SDR family oxidoreductase [Billgrantia diversa]|uniref:SDR family NAD(P)-dependent oxidoreductase n=1 Tax=Halomonas sp. MCCC 1A13316 TaxID=2733487 RepID=UPI0018A5AC6F|nr:SDR family NAD(P)-dependent oxidoreductase [Halomonas sp. MCCC 1A13316]QOR37992.1 SDR family oxidoreductase [Halomonas sp. MCCC 1A13316]
MKLEGNVAIVTGGAKAIGLHIASKLASEGAHVVIADIDAAAAEEAAVGITRAYGREAAGMGVDVTDERQVEALIAFAVERFGTVTILVNNAGIMGPVDETDKVDVDGWDVTMAVNLRGVFLSSKHVIPVMKQRKAGSIINVASITGKRPLPLRLAYATSKMGVIGLGRSLAAEVGKFGIRVNTVCPGSVTGERQQHVFEGIMKASGKSYEEVATEKAEVTALKTFVDPDYIAHCVVYLCSDESWVITGQDINICGGAVMY